MRFAKRLRIKDEARLEHLGKEYFHATAPR